MRVCESVIASMGLTYPSQIKGSRASLLCNVHEHKPCMQYLKHRCEYERVLLRKYTFTIIGLTPKQRNCNYQQGKPVIVNCIISLRYQRKKGGGKTCFKELPSS